MNQPRSKLRNNIVFAIFLFLFLFCLLIIRLFLQPYFVVGVIDGDTIKVLIGPKVQTVRLLGIDTPEVSTPFTKEECFGKEASFETKKLLLNKTVFLLKDRKAPEKDQYGRILRYVFLSDGTFINAKLIKEGYAFLDIYQPIEFARYFAQLEQEAKNNKLGLWKNCSF